MKHQPHIPKRLTALLCALTLALTLSPAAGAAETPAASRNLNKQDYSTVASPVTSYLYANEKGGLTRVEYISGKVVVEDYDSSYHLTGSRTIPMELSKWGGFFAGKDANFLIFGQNNPSESASVEVIRIVKYSKDWTRQGQASLTGANTQTPFDAASLRCDEYNGYLYVHTGRTMFKTPIDNYAYNHQANMVFCVRESDMTISDGFYDIWNEDYGYVSHSFNQFILIDRDGKIITLNHGDSDSTRGVTFMKYYADAGSGKFTGQQYEIGRAHV